MKKVTVYGGCCSRDTFNFDKNKNVKRLSLNGYYARSSFVSMMSRAPSESFDTSGIESSFRKRMVDGDVEKTVIKDMIDSASESKVLVMDFVVERLPVIEVEPGCYITKSAYLIKSVGKNKFKRCKIIDGMKEERKVLFKKAWKDFYRICFEAGINDKILINKLYLTKKINDGSVFDENKCRFIDSFNEQLEFIYSVIEEDVPKSRFISYDNNVLVANREHRWGLNPFHFIDEFYSYQLRKICNYCGD